MAGDAVRYSRRLIEAISHVDFYAVGVWGAEEKDMVILPAVKVALAVRSTSVNVYYATKNHESYRYFNERFSDMKGRKGS